MAIELVVSEFADFCPLCAEMAVLCWKDTELPESVCGACAERLAEVERTLLQLKFDRPTPALLTRNP